MTAPMRFLAVAIIGWIGLRAMTMGLVPGAQAVAAGDQPAPGPATAPAAGFPTIEQLEAQAPPLPPGYYPYSDYPQYAPYPPLPAGVPIYYYYPVPAAPPPMPVRQSRHAPIALEPAPLFFPPGGPEDGWLRTVSALPPLPTVPQGSSPQLTTPAAAARKLDRLQLSSWALLRGRPGRQSLAANGMLGGSQAGARLTYAFDRRLALSLRTSTPIGGSQGGEVAGGVRLTPFPAIPIALTAERRQAIGRSGGRSAFALFLEGGLYDQAVPWRFKLDGYAQAGVVGARRRDLFAEGGFTLTRSVLDRFAFNRHLAGQLSAGLGIWGGVQPDLYRVDAGPRLSLRVRNTMRVHLDWRQRLAGKASPGSGPAVTLAGDF